MPLDQLIKNTFGNKIRIRVSGLILHEDKLLLIKQYGVGQEGFLWLPPGGGLEFGERLEDALTREVKEEVHLDVTESAFLTLTEFVNLPLHAVELFYKTKVANINNLRLGHEPEMAGAQSISEFRFLSKNDLISMEKKVIHQVLRSTEILNLIFKN